MGITLIYDPRRDATNVVRFTKDEKGKRRATQIGSISAKESYLYNRKAKVKETRQYNSEHSGSCREDLIQAIVNNELIRFYTHILNRSYKFSSTIPREQLNLTLDDEAKISAEEDRLTNHWHKMLCDSLARGIKINRYNPKYQVNMDTLVSTADILKQIRALSKEGKEQIG